MAAPLFYNPRNTKYDDKALPALLRLQTLRAHHMVLLSSGYARAPPSPRVAGTSILAIYGARVRSTTSDLCYWPAAVCTERRLRCRPRSPHGVRD